MDVRAVADSQLGADKLWHHLDRIDAWRRGRKPYPVTVEIDVCNLCNHKCPECTFSYLVNKSTELLTYGVAMRLIDELSMLGVKAVTFSGGGEPLLYGEERLTCLMARARQRGMDVALITNGSKWTSSAFLGMCEWIRVSLDAYDEMTFKWFHGKSEDEFHRVEGNLRHMASLKLNRLGHGLKTCTLGIGGLTDSYSVDRGDVLKMSEFCSGIPGVDYVQFRPMVLNRTKDLSGGYDAQQIPELMDQIEEAQRRFNREDFRVICSEDKYRALATEDHEKHYERCHGSFLQCCVGADGNVYICCHWQGEEAKSLGNLYEQSFADIWHGDRAHELRTTLDPRTSCPPACRLHPQNMTLEQWKNTSTLHKNFI